MGSCSWGVFVGSGQGGGEGDRGACEGLAHGAVDLGVLGCGLEGGLVDARDLAFHGEMDAGDAGARLEGDRGLRREPGRGFPASVSPFARAIEKQLEWAAAISSSGLVFPLGSSARDAQVTGKCPTPEESKVTSPMPLNSSPSHSV